MVVTASRVEQRLHDAPAAMTVLSSEDIQALPNDDYGDLLRNVPGLNVAQMSARDVQVAGRSATTAQATGELVMVDDRSVYLDLFGFVAWDFLPTQASEIKQIEVVRGPASAVWGANALTGVIHVVTKAPKEIQGTTGTVGGGELGTLFGSFTHAGVRGRLGYKLSGGYFEQDPYERPTGLIPGTSTPYLPFENQGTEQPKGDLRVDYDLSERSTISASGGWAATDGIMHSGVGPFDIDRGSSMSYGKVAWTRGAMRLNAFVNLLDGSATNLLAIGPTGQRLVLDVKHDTWNLDFSDLRVLGEDHVLTYGLNARTSDFNLSIAPLGSRRDETGVFVQDEAQFGTKVRLIAGARLDDIDPIGTVLSPRVSLLISPVPDHTLRLSWNRAYRAPSLVENYLQIEIINAVFGLPELPLFLFTSEAVGNLGLDEQELTALEAGWVFTIAPGTHLDLAVYQNDLEGAVDFYTAEEYTSSSPAAVLAAATRAPRPAAVRRQLSRGVQLPQRRRSPQSRSRAGAPPRPAAVVVVRQLLVAGRSRGDRHRSERRQRSTREPLQRRRVVGGPALLRRAQRELRWRRVLGGRARRPLPRDHRGVHHDERHGGEALPPRPRHPLDPGPERVRRARAAARLR